MEPIISIIPLSYDPVSTSITGFPATGTVIRLSYAPRSTSIVQSYVSLSTILYGEVAEPGLRATIAGTSTITGILRARGSLVSTIAGTSTISATIKGKVFISATIAGTSTITASLSGGSFISASLTGTSTITAILIGKGNIAALMEGTSTVSGTLNIPAGSMSATIAGTSTVTATLTGKGAMVSVVAGTSIASGTLSAKGSMAATVAGTSTLIATGILKGYVASAIAGTSTATGTLKGKGLISSAIAGTSTVSGTLTNASSGFGEDGFWPLSDVNDSTANANHLTNNNTATFVAGKVADAVNLASASSQYLSRASNALLKTGNISFSFACWVMLASKGSSRTILCKGGSSAVDANDEYHLVFHNGVDRIRWLVSDGNGNVGFVDASTLGSPALDTWYFIHCWHDAAADWIRIQVNNGTVDESAYTLGGNPNGTSSFKIGLSDGSFFWNGKIDQMRYKKGLWTTQQVTDMYNGGNGV